jgi:hypothetical protein
MDHGKMTGDTTNEFGVRTQTFEDGYSAVVVDAVTARRRNLATLACKVRTNRAMGVESPNLTGIIEGYMPEGQDLATWRAYWGLR